VDIRGQHKADNVSDTWNIKHGVDVTGGTVLSHAMKLKSSGTTTLNDANSTHWAAADVNNDKLVPKADWAGKEPNELLAVSAKSGNVVEAFESTFGSPTLGIQWHPECYIPGMVGAGSGSPEVEKASLRIFEFMVYAAMVARLRRGFVTASLDLEKTAFNALCTCAKTLIVAYAQLPQSQREEQVDACMKKVSAGMPDRSLWSRRIDDLVAALDDILTKGNLESAREALKGYGIV
jgi:hypothetical protein